MRVLQINSVVGVGSTGRIMQDIHSSLLDNGHESYVAYGRQPYSDLPNAIRIGNQRSVYAHVAATRLLDEHGFASKKATSDFIRKIRGMQFDIIHLHNIHGYYLNIESLFSFIREADVPVVWTFHDCWPFTGHCAHFSYIDCEKWRRECYECPQVHRYPTALIDRSSRNHRKKKAIFTGVRNLRIVTPSRWLADLINESFLSEYPVEVIHNGIDLDVFKPTESNFRSDNKLENKRIFLGVASVWDERKGLDIFFELSQLISDDEHIVLVGVKDKDIASRKIPSNVTIVPRTNNVKELASLYTTADYFLNPTLEDNFPTTNLEAIACGTPVVTFNTGGAPETITTVNGVVTKEKTAESLYQGILECSRLASVDDTRSMYSKDNLGSSYLRLYRSVLQEKGR